MQIKTFVVPPLENNIRKETQKGEKAPSERRKNVQKGEETPPKKTKATFKGTKKPQKAGPPL